MTTTRVLWALFALVVVGTPLALGGLHTPVLVAAAVLSAAMLAMVLRFERERLVGLREAARVVMGAGVIVVAYTLLQSVPLPAAAVSALSPHTADAWMRVFSPLREPGPAWFSLSLDPTATRVEVLRGALYLGVFVVSVALSRRRTGAVVGERVLMTAGVVMALVALAHPAFRAERVFGAYAPVESYAFAQSHMSPLLNVNHLAGFCHIPFCIALQHALTRKTSLAARVLPLCAALLLVATNLWAASRAGTAALAVGAVMVGAGVIVLRRADGGSSVVARVGLTLAGVLGGAVGYLAIITEARQSLFGDHDFTKVTLVREAAGLVRQAPLWGVGRGAFESVFPVVRKLPGYVVYTHPENWPVQWASEWGLVVAVALALALLFALRWSVVSARSRPPLGAWAGLWALVVHNLADFNLEVPGIAVTAAAALGIVVSGGVSSSSENAPSVGALRRFSARVPWLAAAFAGLASVLMAPVALAGWNHELARERRSVFEASKNDAREHAAFSRGLHDAMARHPAEPYFPYVGALVAASRGTTVVPWVARVLERSPVHGRANLALARWLRTRVPSQARLAYRLAYEQDDQLLVRVIDEAPALVTTYRDALELVSSGPAGARMLDALASAMAARAQTGEGNNGAGEVAARLDEALIAREPANSGPLARRAETILAALRTGDRAHLAEGISYAQRYRETSPSECRGYALEADLAAAVGDSKRALAALDDAVERASPLESVACVRKLVTLADSEKSYDRADHAVDRAGRRACAGAMTEECAARLGELGVIEDQRGHPRRAVGFFKRAYEANHARTALVSAGSVALRGKAYGDAIWAYGELVRLEPDHAEWKANLTTARSAVAIEHFVPHASDAADAAAP